MYEKIDTIKLETIDTAKFSINKKITIKSVKEKLNEMEDKGIYLDTFRATDKNIIITNDNYSVARISHQNQKQTLLSGTSTIEIYGINQIYKNEAQNELFHLLDQSAVITKLDIPIDTYYDHNLTYVLYPQSNLLEQRKNKQFHIAYINGFTTTNIFIPLSKANSIIIKKIKKSFTYKSNLGQGEKNFYTYSCRTTYGGYTSYKNQTDINNSTHLKVVFQEANLYFKWRKTLKDNDFIVEYGSESDLDLSTNRKAVSVIHYNKHENIQKKEEQHDQLNQHYREVAATYTESEEEQDRLYDTMKWNRTELRFKFQATDSTNDHTDKNRQIQTIITTPKLNVYNEDGSICEATFTRLSDIIKKRMEKIEVILFQSKIKEKAFFQDYKIDPKKTLELINYFGKIITVEESEVEKLISDLRSKLMKPKEKSVSFNRILSRLKR